MDILQLQSWNGLQKTDDWSHWLLPIIWPAQLVLDFSHYEVKKLFSRRSYREGLKSKTSKSASFLYFSKSFWENSWSSKSLRSIAHLCYKIIRYWMNYFSYSLWEEDIFVIMRFESDGPELKPAFYIRKDVVCSDWSSRAVWSFHTAENLWIFKISSWRNVWLQFLQ